MQTIEESAIVDSNDIPSKAKTHLEKAINKCNIVIEEYPDSKYVDDAYYIIGKSGFYRSEFTRAQTSFKKLMQREHPFYSSLIRLRSELKSKKDWKEFERKLIYYGYHPLQIHLINFIGSNKFVVLLLRKLKKTINFLMNLAYYK